MEEILTPYKGQQSLWDVCVKDSAKLRIKTEPSTTEACDKACKAMREALTKYDTTGCFGLAANQLDLGARACIITIPAEHGGPIDMDFHNPDIIGWGGQIINQEWCFSLSKKESYLMRRYKTVKIKDDKNGITSLEGIAAYAMQHEVDHLNGILISDRGVPSSKIMSSLISKSKNGECVCGSGRKYKRCCGKDKKEQLQPIAPPSRTGLQPIVK